MPTYEELKRVGVQLADAGEVLFEASIAVRASLVREGADVNRELKLNEIATWFERIELKLKEPCCATPYQTLHNLKMIQNFALQNRQIWPFVVNLTTVCEGGELLRPIIRLVYSTLHENSGVSIDEMVAIVKKILVSNPPQELMGTHTQVSALHIIKEAARGTQ